MSDPTIWRLRHGLDRRFRAGHPWVYSNELIESPKGIEPGAPIELRDSGGKFLARGYGNPGSLIAFRSMSRLPSDEYPMESAYFTKALLSAAKHRETLGLGEVSHRLCFSEADKLPGLVIDRYRTPLANGKRGQIFVIQAHTAGMDRVTSGENPEIVSVLESLSETFGVAWADTAIVLRNDLGVRKLEGIREEEPRVLKALAGLDLTHVKILVASAWAGPSKPLEFLVDLEGGQKTGFFLDQWANIQLAVQRFGHLRPKTGPLRILDLCCYVGQWGSQLAHAFKSQGIEVEVTAFDSSQKALDFAQPNIEAQGARCKVIKGDVLKNLEKLDESGFDIVVSDPPALIKGRKDIAVGTHAYLQLNTQAVRLVRAGGALISCSCSALLEEGDFLKTLAKAANRNNADVRWVARGAQSPDHPMRAEFPEGRYLKCWMGIVE